MPHHLRYLALVPVLVLVPAAVSGQESAASRCASGDPMPVAVVPDGGAELPAPAPTSAAPVPIPNACEVRAGSVVVIRGTTPVLPDPVYVVDGVVLAAGEPGASPLASIPSGDIASIIVQRNAAASARYGARPDQGVVLVETKKRSPVAP